MTKPETTISLDYHEADILLAAIAKERKIQLEDILRDFTEPAGDFYVDSFVTTNAVFKKLWDALDILSKVIQEQETNKQNQPKPELEYRDVKLDIKTLPSGTLLVSGKSIMDIPFTLEAGTIEEVQSLVDEIIATEYLDALNNPKKEEPTKTLTQ